MALKGVIWSFDVVRYFPTAVKGGRNGQCEVQLLLRRLEAGLSTLLLRRDWGSLTWEASAWSATMLYA